MKFPESFILLQQEGYLISSCLASGLTQLRSAHVHNKGGFYSALFNLSIGTERFLKAIIIIEHMLKNKLSVPNKKQLKAYGHNIIELHNTCAQIAASRNFQFTPFANFLDINKELFLLLSEFAQNTRYHNLDALSNSHTGLDPLKAWSKILAKILASDVSNKSIKSNLLKANVVANSINDITTTLILGLEGESLTTEQALYLPALHGQSVRFAVLRYINMFCEFRALIHELSHQAYYLNLNVPPFPQMQEFVEWLWNDRQYVLRKKCWP